MQSKISKPAGQRKRLLSGATLFAAAAAGLTSTPAAAQDASAVDSEEVIVVTGTRIARPGFTSNSPIATIGALELQQQQPVDIEELLRDQPQFAPGNGTQVNNGASGAATVDLRGLSEPRTLPLIDGKRMVGFGPNAIFDTNMVPIGLLERVDVVTGGASAVYGSDAIAGVVNFILNDDFQGLEVRATHTNNDLHDTGEADSIDVTMGASFDDGRGNVALSLGWLDREAIYQVEGPAALAPGASSTTVPSAFDIFAPANPAPVGRQQVTDSGELVNFYQPFDFNGQNLYQQPQERYTATAIARYEINENVEAYGRFMFASQTSAPQLASSGTFGFVFGVPLDSPFLTPQAAARLQSETDAAYVQDCAALMQLDGTVGTDPNLAQWGVNGPAGSQCVPVGIRWRAVPVGPRQYRFEYDTFQTMVGFRGEIGDSGWTYDVAGAYGESSLKRQQNNDLNAARVQQALFATDTTTCDDTSNFCSPLNLFNPSLGITPEAAAFVALNLQVQSITTQEYVTGAVTGDLGDAIRSPFAESPIGLSFGAEWREETSDYQPDSASQAGVSSGFGVTLPVSGEYDVMEFFGEALVPLVENAPLAHSVNLELGYRTSDYSTSGRVESFKYGLDWAPMEDLRFRAMFQQAVRGPSINELFGPFTPGTGDLLTDPCSGVTDGAGYDLFDLCQDTGVPNPATLAQPTSGQVNNFSGGNANLRPETAETITVGFVFRPSGFLQGFSATVDYFDIVVNDAISIRPAFDIYDGCYTAAGNPTFDPNDSDCSLILRNPGNGTTEGPLTFGVNQQTLNIGEVHVEGIDYNFGYEWDIGSLGSIAASIVGTHLLTTSYNPSAGEVDCLGYYGKLCGLPSTVSATVGGPVSEDKFIQSATWSTGPFQFSYRWRYLSSVEIDPRTGEDLSDPALVAELLLNFDDVQASRSIDAYNYFDLAASWQVNEALRLNASVTNITNEEAPFVATSVGSTLFNSGNTYPSTYDTLGRVFTIGATARF